MRILFKDHADGVTQLSTSNTAGSAIASPHEQIRAAHMANDRKKNILILSVSAGAGHVRAAEAIRAYSNSFGSNITATHVDVMNHVSSGFRKLYTDFYITLISKHPSLWGYLYQKTNDALPDSTFEKMRRGVERLSTRNLLKQISSVNPDVIICTHFLPAEILARSIRASHITCPVWVQVTDFDLHRMWVHEGMAGYFAANEEVAFRMQAHGIPKATIHVTGIPVMPAFQQPPSRSECANELGLDPHRLTFLLMGGGAGLGKLDEIAVRLLDLDSDFQLIVLAGRNVEALAALQTLAVRYPDRLVPHGFTTRVERLMACADLVITKPGGLTTSECLSMGLPMIVNDPIPGQEERNADYLLEQGVALKATDATTLAFRIHHLLQNPEKLTEMRAKAKAIGRPLAAQCVLDVVLNAVQT
jgi:processive 1,2-diacylglycerol beta-glucosyltransferase